VFAIIVGIGLMALLFYRQSRGDTTSRRNLGLTMMANSPGKSP
jgi:hypothetical protein